MKSYSKYLVYIIILFTYCSIIGQEKKSDLIGKWKSVEKRNEKITLLVFTTKNEFTMQPVIVADYKYKIKGNLLLRFFHKTYPIKKTIIDTSYLIFKPDTIIRKYGKGNWTNTVTMVRAKNSERDSGKDPLIGTWLWDYPAGHTAKSIYRKNGTMHLAVPRDKYEGHYSVNNDTIKIVLNKNKAKIIYTYWTKGKLLSLKNLEHGNEELFKRIN